MQKTEYDLTEKQSIQIAAYTDGGNGKYYKRDPKKYPDNAVNEGRSGLAQSIQDTGKGNIRIEKRADK